MAIQDSPFQPYTVRIGYRQEQRTISTPEDQATLLHDLNKKVNASHTLQIIRWKSKEDADISKIFQKNFETKGSPLANSLILSPKIKNISIENENTQITTYKNHVIFKEKLRTGPYTPNIEGIRKFPNDCEERGLFECADGALLEGLSIKKSVQIYVYLNHSLSFIQFGNNPIGLGRTTYDPKGKGFEHWQTLTISNDNVRHSSSHYCTPTQADPYTLMFTHLTEKNGLTFCRMCQNELLSPEQISSLIQELFKPREASSDPLIFDYNFTATKHVLNKIKKLKIPVDLYVIRPSTNTTFADHWIATLMRLSKNIKNDPKHVKEFFHLEFELLFAINPQLRLTWTNNDDWKHLMTSLIIQK